MIRTKPQDVRRVIETTAEIDVDGFIRTASAIVDWLEEKDSDNLLSAGLLEQIECYLAAHFYAHRDQSYSSRSTDGASGSFQGQTGMYFESTQHGQAALSLDITGNLATFQAQLENGGKRKVKMRWLGKTRQEYEGG